jgi:hypothetical protein
VTKQKNGGAPVVTLEEARAIHAQVEREMIVPDSPLLKGDMQEFLEASLSAMATSSDPLEVLRVSTLLAARLERRRIVEYLRAQAVSTLTAIKEREHDPDNFVLKIPTKWLRQGTFAAIEGLDAPDILRATAILATVQEYDRTRQGKRHPKNRLNPDLLAVCVRVLESEGMLDASVRVQNDALRRKLRDENERRKGTGQRQLHWDDKNTLPRYRKAAMEKLTAPHA